MAENVKESGTNEAITKKVSVLGAAKLLAKHVVRIAPKEVLERKTQTQQSIQLEMTNALSSGFLKEFVNVLFGENGVLRGTKQEKIILGWCLERAGLQELLQEDEKEQEAGAVEVLSAIHNAPPGPANPKASTVTPVPSSTGPAVGVLGPTLLSHTDNKGTSTTVTPGHLTFSPVANPTPVVHQNTPAQPDWKKLRTMPKKVAVPVGSDLSGSLQFLGDASTPAGHHSFVMQIGNSSKKRKLEGPLGPKESTQVFTTPKAEQEKRKRNKALKRGVDFAKKDYRPSVVHKANKGLPQSQVSSKFALIQPYFLCSGLREAKVIKCPTCRRLLEIVPVTTYSCLMLKLRCTSGKHFNLDISQSTSEKFDRGEIETKELMDQAGKIIEHTKTCNFNVIVSGSRRIRFDSEPSKLIFKRGSDKNRANFNHLTEADYQIILGCHFGMLSHQLYQTVLGSTLEQTVLQKPQYYAVATALFEKDKLQSMFQDHTKLLNTLIKALPELRPFARILAMDTTFSQRRDANFGLTLLMDIFNGFVVDFECLGKQETKLRAIQLEAVASKKLVMRSLDLMKEKKIHPFVGICTDGHIENAEMMKREFYEHNKGVARKGVFLGPTECAKSLDECLQSYSENQPMCGVHAEALCSLGGLYKVRVGGVVKEVTRAEILEFGLGVDKFPKAGDEVHLAKNPKTLLKHFLDLWHFRVTLTKAFETKIGFLREEQQRWDIIACLKLLQDKITEIVQSDDDPLIFLRWISSCHELGSIFENEDQDQVSPELIKAVEELLFAEDLELAALVQKHRLEHEKWLAGCKCLAEACSCGKLPGNVPYVERLKRKRKRRGRPLAPLLDLKKILQLNKKARSSYPESANSHVHKYIHKRRHFQRTYPGRAAYVIMLWNCNRLSEIDDNLLDSSGKLNKDSALYKKLIKAVGADGGKKAELLLTVKGIRETMCHNLHLGSNENQFFEPEFVFTNRFK